MYYSDDWLLLCDSVFDLGDQHLTFRDESVDRDEFYGEIAKLWEGEPEERAQSATLGRFVRYRQAAPVPTAVEYGICDK